MDRPVTSKSRGICRYYTTPRGCFAGDDCKFLHGAEEKLTPYDKAKVCRYYARGHCTRGDKCWFRHVLPKVALDDERIKFSTETCCICLEIPITYGLLTDCNHVFCLECIRQWRTPTGKSPDVVSSGTIKCCPLCRTPSRFITPSAHFFPNCNPQKKETIETYKASMARVPCKYFEETSRTGKPCCPFGVDCFYQHTNSDGTPHVFRHGAKHSMNIYRRHRLRGANLPPARFDFDDPIEFLQHIFENPITNLHATLDVIRASLPAIMERFSSSNESGGHESDEDEGIMGDSIDPLELLGDNLVIHDEATIPLATSAAGDTLQSISGESPTEYAPLSAGTPLPPEIRAAPQPTAASSTHLSPSVTEPARLASRFTTVMGAPSRQTFIIDISDDEEEDEDEEGSVQHMSVGNPNNSVEPPESPLPESTPVSRSPPGQQLATLPPVENYHTDTSPNHPQCEHDLDPPFVTDGRGRVVWSSTRNASGRGIAAESRASRHSRTESTGSRIACPPPSSAHLVSNACGHAWGGQDIQGIDGKGARGEEINDVV